MAFFCYVTDQLREDAKKHNIDDARVTSFASEVEKRQSLAGFDKFRPPFLVKKKFLGDQFRLIVTEKPVREHQVVVLLRILVRWSNDYINFHKDHSWAARPFSAELDEAHLKGWVDERTRVKPPPTLPSLSEVEKTFLWSSSSPEKNFDLMIFETFDWIQAIRDARIADRLIRLRGMILDAADGPDREVQILQSPDDKNLTILTCNLLAMRKCVLLSVHFGEQDNQLKTQKELWSGRLSSANAENVLRKCHRSYSLDVCFLEDQWMAVEKNPEANLALSPEEADILRSCDAHASQQCGLPLFINGRAGSGKSTLLQYLFAQCLLRWAGQPDWESDQQTHPLYVASSPELLKDASKVVGTLLKANHEHLLAAHPMDKSRLTGTDQFFRDFLQFMRSKLGTEADRLYPMPAYINYAKFRRLWMKRFGNEKKAIREFGPQVSWHVIRGLIKGRSVEDYYHKEDYDELPQEEQTISRQVYEAVYDYVWEPWYKPLCQAGKQWDTQDLIRYLLDKGLLTASHAAVFCDEAQDFTRLELEAIYRCCLFSNRMIDEQNAKRIPFVFAGDPFQTLNPTGFRWEAVRAAFTEKIMRSLYRSKDSTQVPKLNYRELTFNYRSSESIVHFCNSIQAVRARLFGHRSLSPQNTWQIDEVPWSPMFFESGNLQMEAALRDQSDLVLIVPCEEGEEGDYVKKDSYLERLVEIDETGTPRNVLSPARAKGLGFLRVALYGWSLREEARHLTDKLRSPEVPNLLVDQRLALEYFLNNLYVAASRAQRRLFVIDKEESRNSLWCFAFDQQHLEHVIRDLPNLDAWRKNTGCLMRGVPESFGEDHDDPRTLAVRFENEGMSNEDSYLLNQAAIQYSIAKEPAKAYKCRALAYLFDGKFRNAGEQFEKAGERKNAIDAYWQGRYHKEIVECAATHSEHAKNSRCRIAAYLNGNSQTLRGCRSLFDDLLKSAGINADLKSDLSSTLWNMAIQDAVKKSLDGMDQAKTELDPGEAGALADRLEQLGKLGAKTDPHQLARLCFASKRYQDVMNLLSAEVNLDLYRDAQALCLISQSKPVDGKYKPEEARIVADYYFRRKEYAKASGFYREIPNSDRVLECLRLSQSEASRSVGEAVLVENSLRSLIVDAKWQSLLSFLTKGQPSLKKGDSWQQSNCKAVLDRISQDRMIYRIVVPALACSNDLSNAEGRIQQPVSEFLASKLIETEFSAWKMDLNRRVAGAAIERAGRDIDAIRFYENWRDSADSPGDREHAERRWVVCKRRQANRQEREGREEKANSYRQSAEKVMEKYGWTTESVPDAFPEIEAQGAALTAGTGETNEPRTRITTDGANTVMNEKIPGDREGTLGFLSYRLIGSKGWINLDSQDGLRSRVLIRARKVTCDDGLSLKENDDGTKECEEWGLKIRWLSDMEVELWLEKMDCKVTILDTQNQG